MQCFEKMTLFIALYLLIDELELEISCKILHRYTFEERIIMYILFLHVLELYFDAQACKTGLQIYGTIPKTIFRGENMLYTLLEDSFEYLNIKEEKLFYHLDLQLSNKNFQLILSLTTLKSVYKMVKTINTHFKKYFF